MSNPLGYPFIPFFCPRCNYKMNFINAVMLQQCENCKRILTNEVLKELDFLNNIQNKKGRELNVFYSKILVKIVKPNDTTLKVAKKVAEIYCRNGKCIHPVKYSCCIGCDEPKPCNLMPIGCQIYFCDKVVVKLGKYEKKILRIEMLMKLFEQQFNKDGINAFKVKLPKNGSQRTEGVVNNG